MKKYLWNSGTALHIGLYLRAEKSCRNFNNFYRMKNNTKTLELICYPIRQNWSFKNLLANLFITKLFFLDSSSNQTCIMNSDYSRTCFRDLGVGDFETGNKVCQVLGGHLPVVTKSAIMTFLASKFGLFWMSLKTDRLFWNWSLPTSFIVEVECFSWS